MKHQKNAEVGYFIVPQVTFASIPGLVTYYSRQSNGWLKKPCCVPKNPILSSKIYSWEIDRKSIHFVKKPGLLRCGWGYRMGPLRLP